MGDKNMSDFSFLFIFPPQLIYYRKNTLLQKKKGKLDDILKSHLKLNIKSGQY